MKTKEKKEVLLNAEIPIDLKRRLKEYCYREGLKIKAVVAKALDEYLKQRGA